MFLLLLCHVFVGPKMTGENWFSTFFNLAWIIIKNKDKLFKIVSVICSFHSFLKWESNITFFLDLNKLILLKSHAPTKRVLQGFTSSKELFYTFHNQSLTMSNQLIILNHVVTWIKLTQSKYKRVHKGIQTLYVDNNSLIC